MIDMGQADRSLYRQPSREQHRLDWTIALNRAASAMGFDHYMDVPDEQVESLKSRARDVQSGTEPTSGPSALPKGAASK